MKKTPTIVAKAEILFSGRYPIKTTTPVAEPILRNDIMLEALALSSIAFEAKNEPAGKSKPLNK